MIHLAVRFVCRSSNARTPVYGQGGGGMNFDVPVWNPEGMLNYS